MSSQKSPIASAMGSDTAQKGEASDPSDVSDETLHQRWLIRRATRLANPEHRKFEVNKTRRRANSHLDSTTTEDNLSISQRRVTKNTHGWKRASQKQEENNAGAKDSSLKEGSSSSDSFQKQKRYSDPFDLSVVGNTEERKSLTSRSGNDEERRGGVFDQNEKRLSGSFGEDSDPFDLTLSSASETQISS